MSENSDKLVSENEKSAISPVLVKKWDDCYQSAYRKFTNFLDDPEQVAVHNAHAAEVFADMPEMLPFYKIADDHTQRFKTYDIPHEYTLHATHCHSRVVRYENDVHVNTEIQIGVAYNIESLEKESIAEVKKITLHELMHAYYALQRRSAEEGLTEEAKITLAKKEELLADSVSDIVIPWPRKGDMRIASHQQLKPIMSEMIRRFRNEADATKNQEDRIFLEEASRVIEYMYLDKESNTHPSNAQFLANSDRLTAKLASKRYDAYLENLYDSYVPEEYAVLEPAVVSFDNQEELDKPYALLPEPEYQQHRPSFAMRMLGKLEEVFNNQVAQAEEIFGDNKELLNKYLSTKMAMTMGQVVPLYHLASDAVQSAMTMRDVLTGAGFGLVTYVAGDVYQRHLKKQVAPEPQKAPE